MTPGGAARSVLPDTSAWIQHQVHPDPLLTKMLDIGRVVGHPMVVGELWLGCGARPRTLAEVVASLPAAPLVEPGEVRSFADAHKLVCAGIGWVDACLLTACAASSGAIGLYSKDRALVSNARRLQLWFDG
jgi:predicted nucleic acid-binding protein